MYEQAEKGGRHNKKSVRFAGVSNIGSSGKGINDGDGDGDSELEESSDSEDEVKIGTTYS